MQTSSNIKDPLWSKGVLNAVHTLQAIVTANETCYTLENKFAEFFKNYLCNKEYQSLLADCQQMCHAQEQMHPSSRYTFLDILVSTLMHRSTCIQGSTHKDEHVQDSSSRLLSLCANAHLFKAMNSSLTSQEMQWALRNSPSLTNDERAIKAQLSCPRMAQRISQVTHASSMTNATALKQSNEDVPKGLTCVLPGMIKNSTSYKNTHDPLE